MKKIILSVLILTSILLLSCQKDKFGNLIDAETQDSISPDSALTHVRGLKLDYWTGSFSATKNGESYDCTFLVKNNTTNACTKEIVWFLIDANGNTVKEGDAIYYCEVDVTINFNVKILNSGNYKIKFKVGHDIYPFWYPEVSPWHLYTNELYLTKISPPSIPSPGYVRYYYDDLDETYTVWWDEVQGATSYKLYTSMDNGVTYNYYRSITGGTTFNHYQRELISDYYGQYKTKISAVTALGESQAVLSTRGTPHPVNVNDYYVGEVYTVSWDAVPGATEYTLYTSTDGGKSYHYYRSIFGMTYYTRELKSQYYGSYRAKISAVTSLGESSAESAIRNY